MSISSIKRNRSADLILDQLSSRLDQLDADIGYSYWMRALMVIFHETYDSEEGFELADSWSSKGSKYRGTKDVRRTWNSFKLNYPNPPRMGTLIWMVNKLK